MANLLDEYVKKMPSRPVRVDEGRVTDFGKRNLWIRELHFCTGIVLYDPSTGEVSAGHDSPKLGELERIGISKNLDEMLRNAPEGSYAYAVSAHDMDGVSEACKRHNVRLQGFRTGRTYHSEKTGELGAYRKDLIVDLGKGKVLFFEKGRKEAEWELSLHD